MTVYAVCPPFGHRKVSWTMIETGLDENRVLGAGFRAQGRNPDPRPESGRRQAGLRESRTGSGEPGRVRKGRPGDPEAGPAIRHPGLV